MANFRFSVLLMVCAFQANAAANWKIAPVSSLRKLTAKAPGVLEPFESTPVQLQAARGEWENFQVVVTAGKEPLSKVRLEATGLATHLGEFMPLSNIQLFREHYVYVTKPSGNRSLEPLWWPDALLPVTKSTSTSIAASQAAVFWIAIRVPADAKPGEYYGAIDVTADGAAKQLAVTLKVEPVTLPKPSMRANVAIYYDVLREWYAKNVGALDDTQFAAMKKRYYEFLLDYRLNAYDLPVAWDSEAANRYLRDDRVLSVRLPPLDSPQFDAALSAFKRNNTLGKAYYYYLDEPPPERYSAVRAATAKLRAVDKRLKHCVTIHPNQALNGFVDIWCPNIGDFFGLGYVDFQRLAAERTGGRETWWYTMVEPKYPYPTWLLDDDAVAVRLYGWMMARWGINGFVYSMAHGWGPNPFENLQSFADTNGDGTLLYPSEKIDPKLNGPLPSIRLMLLRDAIEDYELLRLLPEKQRDAVTRAAVPPDRPLRPAVENANRHIVGARVLLFAALQRAAQLHSPTKVLAPAGVEPSLSWTLPRTRPIQVNGVLGEAVWQQRPRAASFYQSPDAKIAGAKLWLAYEGDHLLAAMRGPLGNAPQGEWAALELAPIEANQRWRFVVTAKGTKAVEKYSREGQFRIEELEWQAAAGVSRGFYTVEMRIPLSVIGNPRKFRLNALQRVLHAKTGIKLIARAHPDAGDARLMPVVALDGRLYRVVK